MKAGPISEQRFSHYKSFYFRQASFVIPSPDDHEQSRDTKSSLESCPSFNKSVLKTFYTKIPSYVADKKWCKAKRKMKKNDLPFLQEKNILWSHWLIARIIEAYPGKNSITRWVKIKLLNYILKRPWNKLCLLKDGDWLSLQIEVFTRGIMFSREFCYEEPSYGLYVSVLKWISQYA